MITKVSPTTKCHKSQDYEYIATNCWALFKITVIDKTPIKIHLEKFVYHAEEEDFDDGDD